MLDARRMQALRSVDVFIHHEEEWLGEPGTPERHPEPLENTVRSVNLGLSPEDWCAIAMREGDEYVGGCCGNMSQLQDLINAAFRDAGYVDAADLLAIGELAKGHDGFEEFDGLDDEAFTYVIDHWATALAPRPWVKIAAIYTTLEPALKQRSSEVPTNRTGEDDAIWNLASALRGLEWKSLFRVSDDEKPQHDANLSLLRARAYDPATKLLAALKECPPDFEGYAIVTPGTDEVLSNMMGQCIYTTRDAAQRVIDLWARNEDTSGEIVAASVTLDGLKLR